MLILLCPCYALHFLTRKCDLRVFSVAWLGSLRPSINVYVQYTSQQKHKVIQTYFSSSTGKKILLMN
jgi:hypothetical protein